MGKDESRTHEQLQRKFFRQTVHYLWDMVKAGRLDELSEKERSLAKIIMKQKEYSDHYENKDILDGREYEAGAAFNPFFHLSIHKMVEDELSSNTPAEAVLFCKAMESKGLSHHDAIHYIMMILIHVVYLSTSAGEPFDMVRYRQLLNECGEVEPFEVDAVIAMDTKNRDMNSQG